MSKLVLDGEHLTLEALVHGARSGVEVEISAGARKKIQQARKIIEEKLKQGSIVYGVNTGFGKLAQTVIDAKDTEALQVNLVHSHAAGVGQPLPREVVRAVLILKANTLAKGFSGVRPLIVDLLLDLYRAGVSPVIPAQGSVGASGDLAPLAHLVLVLLGEGKAEVDGKILPGAEALRRKGLQPVQLKAKEGLALLNGTQVTTSIASLALMGAENLARCADVAAAMCLEGLLGTPVAFDQRIQAVRGFECQCESAENVRTLLEGSGIVASHKDCEKVQDMYSLRCVPQVHGAVRSALRHVREVLSVEINAATDNPLIFPKDEDVLSGGNFHAQPISIAADYLAIAMAQLSGISERRIECLMDPVISGLSAFLAPKSGLHSGFMMAQVTAASLVSENKTLAHPASVDSIPTSANQEDFVSMGTWAARKAWMLIENAERVLAIELLAAAQALDLRKPLKPGKGTDAAYGLIRARVPFMEEDRTLHPDIEAMTGLVQSGELAARVGEVVSLR